MEKLSSILPKSPRTQKADHSNAQPARPGAPLFGRPMGRVSQKVVFDDMDAQALAKTEPPLSFADKFSLAEASDKVNIGEVSTSDAKLSNYTRKGELQKVRIAQDINHKFAKLDSEAPSETSALSVEAIEQNRDTVATATN